MPDPREPLRALAKLVEKVGDRLGLGFLQMSLIVGRNDQERSMIVFEVPEDLPSVKLEDTERDAFDDLAARLNDDAMKDRQAETREGLAELLKDPSNGLFGDDE